MTVKAKLWEHEESQGQNMGTHLTFKTRIWAYKTAKAKICAHIPQSKSGSGHVQDSQGQNLNIRQSGLKPPLVPTFLRGSKPD